MKKFKQKVFDGFSTSQASSGGSSVNKTEIEIPEILGSSNFELKKTVRHGFPHLPSSLAFDPVQSILAIGTKTGSIKLYGKPGVDGYISHDSEVTVTKLQFVINQGGLISVLEDSSVHLWNLKLKTPAIIHSLKFNRERITAIHLPLRSKFLYVGTERGNVFVVNVDSFTISGYQIQWNRAIGSQRNSHPGPVLEMHECPDDENKLLVGYENGLATLWDFKSKDVDQRFFCEVNLKSCSWHPDGKSFTCALHDGSLATWNIKNSSKPSQIFAPHALSSQGSTNPCLPICKVDCRCSKSSEAMFLFTGGLPFNASKHTPSLTVMKGKSVTVLEMDHYILDFVTICDSPYLTEAQEPQAVICLLKNDLIIIDLVSEGYPPFENPYPMDIHESPVTCLKYLADCPSDLVPALYQVSFKQKQRSANCSKLPWPISGGDWKPLNSAYPEVVITGHLDGSVKFWDATAMSLQFLCKLKTSRVFERSKDIGASGGGGGGSGGSSHGTAVEEEPFAIQLLDFDPKQKVLVTAGNCSQVLLYTFAREDSVKEITTIELCFESGSHCGKENQPFITNNSSTDDPNNPLSGAGSNPHSPLTSSAPVSHQNSVEASPTEKTMHAKGQRNMSNSKLNVKSGAIKVATGFQIELCCQVIQGTLEAADPAGGNSNSPPFTALAVNSFLNLLCFANGFGFAIVDTLNKVALMSCVTSDLYGTIHESPPGVGTAQVGANPGALGAINQRGSGMPGSGGLTGRKSPKIRSGPKAQDSFAESCAGSDDGNVNPGAVELASLSSGSSGHAPLTPTLSNKQTSQQPSAVTSPITPSTAGTSSSSYHSGSGTGSVFFSHGGSMKVVPKAPSIKLKRSRSSASNNQGSKSGGSHSGGSVTGTSSGSGCSGGAAGHLTSPPPTFVIPDKTDGGSSGGHSGFSRSRSSSMSSLERADCSDAVQFITFMHSFPVRNDPNAVLTIWLGTSMSSVACVVLKQYHSPSTSSHQLNGTGTNCGPGGSTPVGRKMIYSPSNLGLMCSARGALISICFLDSTGAIVKQPDETNTDKKTGTLMSKGGAYSNGTSAQMNNGSEEATNNDRQFLVLASDKEAKVISLPSHNVVFRQRLTETSYIVRADPIIISGGACLACYVANGHIVVWSLPSLRVLLDAEYIPLTDIRIARTFCFSHGGQAFYLCSPFELQRITISSELCRKLQDSVGVFHVQQQEMPEPPSRGLFKSLFSSSAQVDRDELFGESCGKASKGLAKYQPGTAATNLEGHRVAAGTAAGEAARARQALVERGEKLSQVEEATAQMLAGATNFSKNAEGLADKYKNKKWYQL
ncbi:syntaxin-binding protein 5-like isoform X2 [Convolutriloba macropyga]|uniref:syntaxin-binding protein 5-like isoform X2 n=1 Tax=Convolutriloba macropyga TaxID=536237 RepID=UPI003F527E9F